MKKLLILFFFIFLYADIDPFKAGDLNSPSPYGLTPTEKAILKNKKEIKKNTLLIKSLQKKLQKLKSKVTQKFIEYDDTISELQTKYAGLNSLLQEVDTIKSKMDKLNKKLKDINLTILNSKIKALEEENQRLKKAFEEYVKIQNQNLKTLNSSIETILKELKELKSKKSLNVKEAMKKAKAYFFGNQLNKAKELFLYTLENGYLPATSSYYLGEIAFKQKNYKEAIFYYKKSITLYPKKTSFTAKLLYHTGISFLKLNQKEKAKLTFQKLINDFPNSKFAKLAKKKLEKL
ncbi:MAG TPA: tetratricopeptide repeat protein [Nautiliaceae bacterium]|nr:tetratricopeptide repeat protein [Nautiliaceae bacterium]